MSQKLAGSRIDVLINNAGIYTDDNSNGFGRLDYQAWTHSLVVNTEAPIKMAEAFLPQIKTSDKGLIVNISSLMWAVSCTSPAKRR
ncbi:MAG: SDR family NAD(P)-dependent oxidoreductase [Methylococcales bacterium]|nr:SDR family NAD(P)-dependent oxidoreductase [Methylococcales bacterium]